MMGGRRSCKSMSQHIDWHFWFRVVLFGRRCGECTRCLMPSEVAVPKMGAGVQQSSELRHDKGLLLLK